MQNSLFSPASRHADPSTSRAAAEKVSDSVTMLQQLVLDYVKNHRGTTDREMVEALRKEHGGSESTYRTRRAELVDMGLVAPLGVVEIDGSRHKTWTATANAFL